MFDPDVVNRAQVGFAWIGAIVLLGAAAILGILLGG